ncbi:Phytochrome-like protein cph1 [Phycisphaerae bacterium RAS1]|nr:Phytochrome-like protein cph1 [Phycisphaerae bacterium RAS1]
MRDRLTILVVDDDKADRLAIRQVLRDAPFDAALLEAEGSEEALRRLAENAVDCVILDHRLSGELGLELLRSLRQREADRLDGGVPIVVLTGRGDELVAVEAMKSGATDYVPKSELTAARLASAIRTGIEIHHQRGAALAAQAALRRAHDALEQRVRQRTQELEFANEELRRRNLELDEFTYIASHDLQEPLRKLTSFSRLLARDVGAALSPQALKDLDFICEAARRMQALVQDLLELSRTGKTAMKRQTVSLHACADQALEALKARVEETNPDLSRDDLPEVVGDMTMLTQLYQNLIGNALKFRSADRRPSVRLTVEQRDGQRVLGVLDNGIGIKDQYSSQIFAAFKRLHGRDEYEGTGIGLAICRKAVERHGGTIWVESQPGKGSHFRFTLGNMETAECPDAIDNRPSFCSRTMTPATRS